MKKIGYPFDKYTEWLEGQGRAKSTACMYASQCRRILRNANILDLCDPKQIELISRDQIEDFLSLQRTSKNRTPFRRSWTMFKTFMAIEGYELSSISIDGNWELIPKNVAQAIRELDSESFPFRLISSMKWNKDEVLSEICGGIVLTVIAPNGEQKKIKLPIKPVMTIIMWAYPNTIPNEDNWLVPREPFSRHPMPVTMLRKVAGIIS